MVSILPSSRTPWDLLGAQTGQALQQVLPQAIQQRQQREMGLNALNQAKAEIAQANGDPMKIAMALSRMAITSPEASRALGPIGQAAISQASAMGQGAALQEATGAGLQTPSQPSAPQPSTITPISEVTQQPQPATATVPEGKKTAENIDAIANQYIAEVRPDLVNPASQYGAIATFDSELKQDITPQEEARLRQQLFDKYKNPAVINSVVDRVREGVKTRYNEALAKYGFDKEKLAQIKEKWNEFTQGTNARLQPHLGKYDQQFPRTKEILTNKYNQYAGASPVKMTPQQMHSNAMALLQNDINKIDALSSIPSMPPMHSAKQVEDYINLNKKAYKDLADMGFTEALREDALINKDMGNEEFHSLIWGDQTSKPLLNEIHSLQAPKEYNLIRDPNFPTGRQKYNPEYPKQHEKYVSELSNRLKKLKPDDDLVLARSMVLDSGGDIKDFVQALTEAQNEGLKLSEFQRSQLQEINIPRMPPLWEMFQREGLLVSPFINYLRGKK